MIIKKSELSLVDFQVFQSDLKFSPPKSKGQVDRKELFDNYIVDIDFTIQESESSDILLIFIKCEINKKKKNLGYIINCNAVSVFDITNAKASFSKEEVISLVQFSGVSIAINNIRNYIQQITYYGPLKDYQLPAIDLNHLLVSKRESLSRDEEE